MKDIPNARQSSGLAPDSEVAAKVMSLSEDRLMQFFVWLLKEEVAARGATQVKDGSV